MPSYTVEADGQVIPFEAPEGASQAQLRSLAARALKKAIPEKQFARPVLEDRIRNPKPKDGLKATPWTLANAISDKATAGLAGLGMDEGQARRLANKATSALSDFTPVGAAVEGDEARRAWGEGNYLGAAGHGALAALSALPGGGTEAVGIKSIIAPLWHGSPHKFDRFALSHIGTGEGAQAFGHGLYFAEAKDVAEEYQRKLAPTRVEFRGEALDEPRKWWAAKDALEATGNWRVGKALDQLHSWGRQGYDTETALRYMRNEHRNSPEMVEAVDALAREVNMSKDTGHLYEVQLDAEPEDFLDWDRPLTQQPNAIREALGDAGFDVADKMPSIQTTASGKTFWIQHPGGWEPMGAPRFRTREKAEEWLAANGPDMATWRTGQNLWGQARGRAANPAAAAENLRGLGLPGIKYFDAGSRASGHVTGDGTRNYVVWDDSLIDLLARY